MNTILFAVCVLMALASCTLSVIKFTHFFQLNSYRASLQIGWMKANLFKIAPNVLFGALSIVASIFGGTGGYILFAAAMVFGAIASIPKKAKKPLVYTMRVRRLLATTLILFVVSFAAGFFAHNILLSVGIYFVLCPIVAIVANIINMPLEKGIVNHYINDAKKLLASSNARVIGITGSYGKTSVKYYLSSLLKAKYSVLMTPESYNTPMGVVKTIRSSLNPFHEIFVCEMGAKRVGEIKEICDIVKPEIGVITSVGPQHLQTFKSLDNVKKTKFELAAALPDEELLFLNGDDENIEAFYNGDKAVTYSLKGKGAYNASNIRVSRQGTDFTVTSPDGESCDFSTKLIGTHNVLNITGAIAVAHKLGIDLASLKGQVSKLASVPHRLELVPRGKDIIIDDAYNSNPSGTKAALETLSYFDGFKILLTPGMVELGDRQDELNKEFGKNAATVCDYVILVGKAQTEAIAQGLKEKGFADDKIFIAPDFAGAIAHAYALNTKDISKIILLENDLPDNY